MKKVILLAVAGMLAAAGGASAGDIDLEAIKGGIATYAEDDGIAAGKVEVELETTTITKSFEVDNSIKQIARMRNDVEVNSKIKIDGNGNFKAFTGNGNGSVGGGISVSAIGAANSVSSTVARATGGGLPD